MGKGHLNKNSHFVVASKVSYGDKASNSTNESHVTMNATATNTTTNATVVVSTSTDDSGFIIYNFYIKVSGRPFNHCMY